MTTITLKNIPEDTYARVKDLARTHHRSINSEIIFLLEQATGGGDAYPEDFLSTAQSLRELTAKYRITDKELTEAKNRGRS